MKTNKAGILSLVMVLILLITSVPFSASAKNEVFNITFTSPSGISESGAVLYNVTTDKFDTCYGNQLTGMAREIYDAFTENYAVKKEPSEITVRFNSPYKFTDIQELSDFVGIEGQAALDAFCYDHPEVFWLRLFCTRFSFSSAGGKYALSMINISPLELYDGASADIAVFDKAVDLAVEEIGKSISDIENRRDVLLKIHNYVCENASYSPSFNDSRVYSPASFFIGSKYVVCEGYSKSFKILCDRFGIPCVLVSGTADSNMQENAPHMWNYVEMEDGRWYLVDTTWDDQGSTIYETYFLANYNSDGFYEKISEERRADTDFSNTGKKQFAYPELSTTAYVPHTHIWNSDFTTDKNAECEADGLKSIHCSGCMATKNQTVIPQTGHSWQITSDKKVCSLCGKSELIPTEATTAPVTTTTAKPTETTTAPTVATTAKPIETTTAPAVATTVKPTETTTAPAVATTVKPTETTTAPTVATTVKPTETTTAPAVATTVKPTETITAPTVATTVKPTETTTAPAVATTVKPSETTTAPVTVPTTTPSESVTKPSAETVTKPSEEEHTHIEAVIKGRKATYTAEGLTDGIICSLCGEILEEQKPLPVKKLSRVRSLKVKSTTANSVKLTFKKVTGAEKYTVYYSTNKKKWKSIKTEKTSLTVKGLKSGTKYFFKVRASAGSNLSKDSDILTVATRPSRVSLASVKSAKKGNLTVSWKAVKGADGYILEYSTSKKFKKSKKITLKAAKTKKATVKKLKSGKIYYVRVKAYKTVNGKTCYGKVSASKNIKVK